MRKHAGMIILAAIVVAALLANTVTYAVDETSDIVLIKKTAGGIEVRQGREDAGLHFKWPWPVERVVRYSARRHVFEDAAMELSTRDKQNIVVTTYCDWRIKDAEKFHNRLKTVERGQNRLRERLRAIKADVVARHQMSDFVNTDPDRMALEKIEDDILQPLRQEAMSEYGIEICQVGVKSLGLPEGVSGTVIEAQIKERKEEAERYRSEGAAQATAIKERAKSASALILAFAGRKAQNIRSEGERAAASYYPQFNRNEQFSMFLRWLESIKKELGSKAVIVLDGSEWFRTGPSLPRFGVPAADGLTNPVQPARD